MLVSVFVRQSAMLVSVFGKAVSYVGKCIW